MIQRRAIRLTCLALLAAGLVWVPAAFGASAVEELSRRMPDDVIAFVGTSGGDALKGDFDKTPIGRIWNDQGVQTFCQSIRTALMAKANQESGDPDVGQKVDFVLNYVHLALSRPIVLGIAQISVQDGPPITGFAIVDAGDRKAEFTDAVSKLEEMAGQDNFADKEIGSLKVRSLKEDDGVPLYWGWAGSRFVIAVNDAQGAAVKYLSQPHSTAPASLGKVPGNGDAVVVTADIQKARQLIATIIREESSENDANTFTTVLKNLGFAEVKSFCLRAGFTGSDVIVQGLLEMPTPGTGVFAACKSIDPAWFGAVDARAVTANATNLDVAALYDTIMSTLKAASPDDAYPAIQNALNGVESELNLKIRDGLLASLAGPAVSYTLPAGSIAEAPRGGFVVAAKLKDAALFEKAVNTLGEIISKQANGMLQISEQKQDDGRVVHVWTIVPMAMMGLMPSWSIAQDHVVIGSSVELCDLGVKQLASAGKGKSLLDVESYKKATAQLPKDLHSLAYIDSGVQLNQIMMQLQQVWPMATMVAMQQGIKLPVMLPSLTQIAKDMGPSIDCGYVGPDGLHMLYRGSGIEASQMAVAGGALGAGILMPALAKARQQARGVASMSNLKQIGLALHMYAQDNDDKFPPDLDKLGPYLSDTQKALESPDKPKDFSGPSYFYVAGQNVGADYHNVLVYENPEFRPDKVNVLFLDGHVEAMSHDAFEQALEATCKRLGREMPDSI